jgi:hypothetical protein
MGNLQHPVQLPQSGVSSLNFGTVFSSKCNRLYAHLSSLGALDSLPMESNVDLEMIYPHGRASEQPDREQNSHPPPPEAPLVSPGPMSAESQGGCSANQAPRVPGVTSQPLSGSSSGTSGAPSAMPSGQGGRPIPSETLRPEIDTPASSHNDGANEVADEILLKEVVPEKGPMTGRIPIVILGEHFPDIPLYVGFGNNWVHAVSGALISLATQYYLHIIVASPRLYIAMHTPPIISTMCCESDTFSSPAKQCACGWME